jgi:putative Mg2+ transporter-C (MgtC) family protein
MRASLQLAIFGRIALATAFGYLIGLERQFRGKEAGDRTFALLGMGSSALVGLSIELFPTSADRVIQGVATGIGFLGAGIIFRKSERVRGLTTAAAIWAATAIGVLCGTRLYLVAGLTTVLTILVLESISLPGIGLVDEETDQADDG